MCDSFLSCLSTRMSRLLDFLLTSPLYDNRLINYMLLQLKDFFSSEQLSKLCRVKCLSKRPTLVTMSSNALNVRPIPNFKL